MEVRINKEVRNYQESLFFGLSLRQLLFALLAAFTAPRPAEPVPAKAKKARGIAGPPRPWRRWLVLGAAAAAAGGYTTVCPMPNLNPVPDSMEHLGEELAAIEAEELAQEAAEDAAPENETEE